MIGGSRKVKPQQFHQHQQQYQNVINTDFDTGWSSSDNETLSAFAYALRKVRKSEITRWCDKDEIESIEKRFEDTSRVIFKELEKFDLPLLRKSYRRPFRSDVVAIGGMRVTSPNSETQIDPKTSGKGKPLNQRGVVPTMDNIWREPEPIVPTPRTSKSVANKDNLVKNSRTPVGKNTVSPDVVQKNGRIRRRGGGICRVT